MINTEIKVGIFVVFGSLMFGVMASNIEKFGFGREGGYSIYVILDTAQGLVKNSHVKISGVPIGRIRKIDLKGEKARAEIVLPDNVKVQNDSVAYIKMESLLGEKFLDIVPGPGTSKGSFLKEGGEIGQGGAPPDLDRLISQLNRLAKDMTELTEAFKGAIGGASGKETIGEIVSNIKDSTESLKGILGENRFKIGKIVENLTLFTKDLPEISKDVKMATTGLTRVAERINRGEGTIGKLLENDDIYNRVNESISNISDITGVVKRGEGSLGKLVYMDDLYEGVKSLTEVFGKVASRLEKGEGTLGALLNSSSLYDEVVDTVSGLNRVVGRVEKGEGTLGKLVTDASLYDEASQALRGVARSTEALEEQVPITTLGVIVGTVIR